MQGAFIVEQPTGERWELALDLLRRGDAFSMGRITFRRIDASTVEAAVASAWLPENVTQEYAVNDLRGARAEVELLLASDEAFRETIGASALDYVLIYDYGNGSIELCRLAAEGEVEWLTARPPSS